MTIPQWILLVLLALNALMWIVRAIGVYAVEAMGPVLGRDSYADLRDAGLVSIIVPAKDEEANIGAALETILAQAYRHLEVIVVSDRSTDRTAEIVRETAARDERVRMIEVESLPEGWFGKPHALSVGAEAARGDYLLFVDADCRLEPHAVRAGLGFLIAREADCLSLWPVLEMRGFWENAIEPVAAAIIAVWFRPSRVNSPKWPTAFACGQYLLIRRGVYGAVGGWEGVKDELAEDVALARAVKGSGHRLLNGVGGDLYRTRMYESLKALWHGWTRIYAGTFRSVPFLAAAIVMILLFSVLPVAGLAGTGVALAAGAGGTWLWACFVLALVATGALLVTVRCAYVIGRVNGWYVLLYPAVMGVVLAMLGAAVAQVAGLARVHWRGTAYKNGRVVD